MSTTDQPVIDAEASRAARGAWAVPGVDRPAAGSTADQTSAAGDADTDAEAEVPGRESPEAVRQAAVDWQRELQVAATGGPGGHVHPVIAAVAACVTALDAVREAGMGTLSVRELRMLLLAIAHVLAAAVALKLRLLAAADAKKLADLTGATCTAAAWAHLTRGNRPDASGEVRLAKDLDTRYPLLAAAFARGLVSLERLRVCVTALRRLPKDLPAGKLTDCQQALIAAAQELTPRELKVLGRRLWEVIDPDGAEAKDGEDLEDEEERARAKAYFISWRNGDGTTGFRGKLPDVQADMLLKLLHAYASPRRRANPNITTSQPDDTRNASAPDDDGWARDADNGGDHDEDDGAATGKAGAAALAGASADSQPEQGPPGHAANDGLGDGSPGEGRCDGSARDGCLEEGSAEESETGKTIPYPVRLGHALMDLLERLPKRAIPDAGGIAATVVVTLREDQLRTGLGTATLDTGTAITAGQARRLACEAGLVPMVLGGPSEPLDVGREQRLFTKPQRLAVSHSQDGICGIHGCDRPITEYHHPFAWSHGGETSIANCLGLCGYHHRLAHHPKWRVVHLQGKFTFERVKQ